MPADVDPVAPARRRSPRMRRTSSATSPPSCSPAGATRFPVSAFPVDGTWPTATSRWEKRNIADEIPVWDAALCIQCNKCVEICPHAAIRAKYYPPEALVGAPTTFHSTDFRSPDVKGMRYTLQVAPEDCTGCELCVQFCPVKDKVDPKKKAINMRPQPALRDAERQNFEFFLRLPSPDRTTLKIDQVKSAQFLEPLFEFSGACSGCGETPYLKLLTQLFGDRAVIANATGCTSIFGGNLPTTPYTKNSRGPRSRVVQFAVRGQRRVRPRAPFGTRPEGGHRPRASPEARAPRRRARRRGPAPRRPVERGGHCRPTRPRFRPARQAGRLRGRRRRVPARRTGRLPRSQERVDRRRRRLGL